MRALASLLLGLAACSQLLEIAPPPVATTEGPETPYWTFADDFELGDLRRWTQHVSSPNGTLTVDTGDAASGCCALHATLAAGPVGFQYALVSWPATSPSAPPLTSGTIAVRARIKAVQLDPDTRELSVVEGGASASAFVTAGLGATGTSTGDAWGFVLSDPSTAGFAPRSANVVPDALGGWHCVELVVNVASDAGHVAVFMDGSAVPQIDADANTSVAVGWDSVTVGLSYASGVAPAEILLDDVQVALSADLSPTLHIGCD